VKITVFGSQKELTGKPAHVGASVMGTLMLGGAAWLGAHLHGEVFGYVVTGLIGSSGGYVLFQGVKGLMAFAAFSQSTLACAGEVLLGGVAEVRLELVPKKSLKLNGAKLTVTCEEWAEYSAGTDTRTYTETIWQTVQDVEMPKVLEGPYRVALKTALPRTIAPTYTGKHNKLRTIAKLDLDIDNWPDLQLQTEVTVLAELAP
jgi:hypothetical protein